MGPPKVKLPGLDGVLSPLGLIDPTAARDDPGLMPVKPTICVLLMLLLSVCGPVTDPNTYFEERLSLVDNGDPLLIAVPESAMAGTPFEVRVTTYGNGCWKRGPTRVSQTDQRAEIVPFDTVHVRDYDFSPCPSILNYFQHQVAIAFNDPGPAVVIVRGRRHVFPSRLVDTIAWEYPVIVR